jgi:hypothetical protein
MQWVYPPGPRSVPPWIVQLLSVNCTVFFSCSQIESSLLQIHDEVYGGDVAPSGRFILLYIAIPACSRIWIGQ